MAFDLQTAQVNMQNALVRAGNSLTLNEKRLVMIGIAKLDSKGSASLTGNLTSKVTVAEFAELAELNEKDAYKELKRAANNLYEQKIEFFEPDHKRKGAPLLIHTRMRWVGAAKYHMKEGWVELKWWYEVLPFLTTISRDFTKYKLKQATALRSVYSWRLLELLMRFQSTGWAEYSIEDFYASMQAPDSLKKDFGASRRRIIEPAVKELIAKDGWLIEWTAIKAGRKVKALRFEFSRNPQGTLDLS